MKTDLDKKTASLRRKSRTAQKPEIAAAKTSVDASPLDASSSDVAKRAESTLNSIEQVISADHHQDGRLPFDLPQDFLLSIVVPVYNERNTVAQIIESLYGLPLPIEVIAVDDGSTDGSIAELTRVNREYPELRVLIQEKNQGKGAALRRGFAVATGSHVMVQDADFEYQPEDIPSLIEPFTHGNVDAVFGSRFLEERHQGSSTIHRLGNAVLTRLSNWMTGMKLTDMETGYKVVRRDLLNAFSLNENGFGFEVELTAKLAARNARIVERPISYVARGWEEGKKIGIRDAIHAFYCIARYGFTSGR